MKIHNFLFIKQYKARYIEQEKKNYWNVTNWQKHYKND
jgi:hypothetical protein